METKKNIEKVFPASQPSGFESDRSSHGIWVSDAIFGSFVETCRNLGRKSCDVLEPLMEAFSRSARNKKIYRKELCPFQAVQISIGTIRIAQKYGKRGRKKSAEALLDSRWCPMAREYVNINYCRVSCRHGGKNTYYQKYGVDYEICQEWVKA